MGNTTFTISTTTELIDEINKLIGNKHYNNISDFFNKTGWSQINDIRNRFFSDFIYYLGFPTLAFLGLVFLSITLINLFFYILTIIVGIYIVVLFHLFYNKYHKEKR